MKSKILLVLFGLSLLNCNKNPTTENPPPAPTEVVTDSPTPNEVQTARNSLDYLGRYKGKLPCADCAGIETSLELAEDFTYVMSRKYLGKNARAFESKGTFKWNDDETAIILDNKDGQPNMYFVGDHALVQLGAQGKKIEGKLADSYKLRKMPEAEAAKTDAAVKQSTPEIVGIHWKLIELNGKPVVSDGSSKDYYIEFMPDNLFRAFAGCNKLNGHYEYSKDKIHFMRVVGTMMACPNMETEETFKEALESVNNFIRNDKILQFRQGEKFLAKFEATTK
jgi:copper homeostasis protein (lipoprotein)